VKLITREDFFDKIRNGEITHSLILAAVCFWKLGD